MSAEATEMVEPALDAIDDVVEMVEVVRNNPAAAIATGLLGLVAGGVGGYFIARKVLSGHYSSIAEAEIAEAKVFYANLNKTGPNGEPITPQSIMAELHGAEAAENALRMYRGEQSVRTFVDEDGDTIVEEVIEDDAEDEAQLQKLDKKAQEFGGRVETTKTQNVFVDPMFDYEEELKTRTPTAPYVISYDEYYEAALEYDNASLVYYQMDDTLANERDEPIRDVDQMIGDDNLIRFGHGSKDANTVFVRNDRLGMDFEVIQSSGSYASEVLGIESVEEASLKHSDDRDRRRAFKRGDG